ncbi:cytochrome b N-terminal domain-containing protein [bacterium]|nr:cytochrome b N-terminal domain-containing protein [bacterium]
MRAILNFFEHIHPRKIPAQSLDLKNTWGLGGMSLVLFFLLVGSGSLMLFVYDPFPESAYESILHLQTNYLFGSLIRNIHYFSANALVIILILHMLRVFFTQGFREKRRGNWVIGLCLLGFVLTSCFTGYLLPWDQIAYWAITICIHILDYVPAGELLKDTLLYKNEISANTLKLFFTLHTTIIPVCLIITLAIHFWNIRKAKGLVTSISIKKSVIKNPVFINTMPHLFLRELAVSLILIAVILLISTLFDAPLAQMANAGLSPNPAKAPWYFAGLQELLLHFHPLFGAFIIPLCSIFLMIILAFIPVKDELKNRWFISEKGRLSGFILFLTGLFTTSAFIVVDEYFLGIENIFKNSPTWLTTGIIPLGGILLFLIFLLLAVKKKFELNRTELIQACFILIVTIFITLTFTGIWFRGENMNLMWAG